MASLMITSRRKGMSFEESSDEDNTGNNDESDVFHAGDGDQEILISSTNDISDFNEHALHFKFIRTLWISLFMICVSIGVFVFAAVIPFQCDGGGVAYNSSDNYDDHHHIHNLCKMHPISLILYVHCGMWALFLILSQGISQQHLKIRRRGYMDFYEETRVSSQLPLWIVSAWSTLLLAVGTVLHDHCHAGGRGSCAKSIHLTKTDYMTICIGLESLSVLVALFIYIYQVCRFNKSKNPPDVFREDMMNSALDFNPNGEGEISEEIFHRQADIIRYYKDRNIVLQRTVMHINHHLQRLRARGADPDA